MSSENIRSKAGMKSTTGRCRARQGSAHEDDNHGPPRHEYRNNDRFELTSASYFGVGYVSKRL